MPTRLVCRRRRSKHPEDGSCSTTEYGTRLLAVCTGWASHCSSLRIQHSIASLCSAILKLREIQTAKPFLNTPVGLVAGRSPVRVIKRRVYLWHPTFVGCSIICVGS